MLWCSCVPSAPVGFKPRGPRCMWGADLFQWAWIKQPRWIPGGLHGQGPWGLSDIPPGFTSTPHPTRRTGPSSSRKKQQKTESWTFFLDGPGCSLRCPGIIGDEEFGRVWGVLVPPGACMGALPCGPHGPGEGGGGNSPDRGPRHGGDADLKKTRPNPMKGAKRHPLGCAEIFCRASTAFVLLGSQDATGATRFRQGCAAVSHRRYGHWAGQVQQGPSSPTPWSPFRAPGRLCQ